MRWLARGGSRGAERIDEWLVAIFCLGVLLFSPLLIRIFDRGSEVELFGVPLLYFYLFGAWAVLVGLIAWVMERQGHSEAGDSRRIGSPTLSRREENQP